MGGVIIISILLPLLLIGNLRNIYLLLMIVATIWMGCIGFLDDYRKLKYHNKDGLKGKIQSYRTGRTPDWWWNYHVALPFHSHERKHRGDARA